GLTFHNGRFTAEPWKVKRRELSDSRPRQFATPWRLRRIAGNPAVRGTGPGVRLPPSAMRAGFRPIFATPGNLRSPLRSEIAVGGFTWSGGVPSAARAVTAVTVDTGRIN
ncbi:MAG TPA: hypothetical protein VFY97_09105, partial [Rhodanobacteraceae bacterium]|nr:hypothetical protein [Rhodanobacteraceae bacterium]